MWSVCWGALQRIRQSTSDKVLLEASRLKNAAENAAEQDRPMNPAEQRLPPDRWRGSVLCKALGVCENDVLRGALVRIT